MTHVRIRLILDVSIEDYIEDLWENSLQDLVDISDAEFESLELA